MAVFDLEILELKLALSISFAVPRLDQAREGYFIDFSQRVEKVKKYSPSSTRSEYSKCPRRGPIALLMR